MNCKHCQAPLEDGNSICPSCGWDNSLPEELKGGDKRLEVHNSNGEIDLSDGTAITFTYLDRFTVKMPWDADIAYKLGNVRTVVEQLEANQTGTINLMNDGRADFIPE